MLVVSAYPDKSSIEGLGLFAAIRIKKNDLVWIFNPQIDVLIPKNIVDKWPLDSKLKVEEWGILSVDNVYMLCMDNGVYINRSRLNNIGTGDVEDQLVALRDIEVGEEITTNAIDFEYAKLPVMADILNKNSMIH